LKKRYLALGLAQLLFIFASGWLRRISWGEIDFSEERWPLNLQFSFYFLAAWAATISAAILCSLVDKMNRSPIILFLVLLLPWIEFFLWFFLSF
jgi:hypothetical protein